MTPVPASVESMRNVPFYTTFHTVNALRVIQEMRELIAMNKLKMLIVRKFRDVFAYFT